MYPLCTTPNGVELWVEGNRLLATEDRKSYRAASMEEIAHADRKRQELREHHERAAAEEAAIRTRGEWPSLLSIARAVAIGCEWHLATTIRLLAEQQKLTHSTAESAVEEVFQERHATPRASRA